MKLSLSHWYPGSGVVLGCIDSSSLPFFLLCISFSKFFPYSGSFIPPKRELMFEVIAVSQVTDVVCLFILFC